jgi:hypothetical protein
VQWATPSARLLYGRNLPVTRTDYVWTAKDIALVKGLILPLAEKASYLWTARDVRFPRVYRLSPTAVAYVWSAQPSGLIRFTIRKADRADYQWDVHPAEFFRGYLVKTDAAHYHYTARQVFFTSTAPVTGGLRIDHVISDEIVFAALHATIGPQVIQGSIGPTVIRAQIKTRVYPK